MAYVNGEWVDQEEEDSANPMMGLASTSTPGKQGATMSDAWQAYESPDWQSKVNTMGLNPNWDTLKTAGQANNISPEDWSKGFQHYNDNITPFAGNSEWWGQEAMTRAAMQGYAGANPTANFNWSQYNNPGQERSQQAVKAQEGMARQNQGGDDDFFSSLLPLLLVGGLGIATGGFGFGAAGGVGAAAGEGALAAGGMSFAPEAFASSFIPNASVAAGGMSGLPSFLAPGAAAGGAAAGMDSVGDWAGDFGGSGDFSVGNTLADVTSSVGGGGSDFSLYDMFNQGGMDFEGASSFMGNPGASATNLEQALQIPNVDVSSLPPMEGSMPTEANLGGGYDTVGPIDPATPQGFDTPASIRELSRNAPISDQARLGLKGLKGMTSSPQFQVPKTLYNIFSQNQKAQQLEKMMSRFEKQSDVGEPFRNLLMRSMSDPNFFKSMPEFNANMASFNKQYGANAAAKGGRSQLGNAAHNIAVNREGSRLADIYRSRIGPLAAMQPNMSGMAAMAPALANAQGNQFNSLFDPQLWKSLEGFV